MPCATRGITWRKSGKPSTAPDDRAFSTTSSQPLRPGGLSRLRSVTIDTRATTVRMSAASRAARGKALLLPQQVITSPETKLQYRIDSLLGQGGFGQAYLATRLTRSRAVPAVVAIKASEHIDGWLREAYFGQILEGHARAIRVFDAFPLTRGRRPRPLLPRARVREARRPAGLPPAAPGRAGPSGPRGARSRGSSRSSASSTAARCSTAT